MVIWENICRKIQYFYSVKARILKLNQKWKDEKELIIANRLEELNPENQSQKDAQYTDNSTKNTKTNENSEIDNVLYEEALNVGNIVILLYNQWGDRLDLGYYRELGWLIFDRFHVTLEYQQKLRKLPENFFDCGIKQEKVFLFESPNPTWCYEYEFISENSGDALIKEWLDTGMLMIL